MFKSFSPSLVIATALGAPTFALVLIWLSFHVHRILEIL
jgi:hypothetical protein